MGRRILPNHVSTRDVPILFNVSGPYGVGKDTILDEIQRCYPGRTHRVRALTTRRTSPSADPYYESASAEEFANRTAQGKWIVNHQLGGSVGYAISIDEILSAADEGFICIQSIFPGPQGAGKLREEFGTSLMSLGVLASGGDLKSQLLQLERRLVSRGRDDLEAVRERLRYQSEPIQYIMNNECVITDQGTLRVFDEIIFNDNLQRTLQRVVEIFAKGFGTELLRGR